MQDDFDDEMELPDDELAGDSLSEGGDLGLGDLDVEPEMDDEAPSRPSGGARAMQSAGSPARKAAPAAKAPVKKAAAKKAAPKAAPQKAAAKKKAAPKKKTAKAAKKSKKAAPKKASKKAAKKKPAKKAGKKR